MSLDRNSPDNQVLGRLGLIGHPWHGVCRNGILTLPNGSTMSYPQPVGGDAFVLRVPGVPAVARTPEEQAADDAAGRRWLDYAILSGTTCQLYSQPLGEGRWIYADPSGDRWLVSTTLHGTKVPDVEGGTITVTLTRFGVIGGGASESYSHTVSVPALGQDAPRVHTPDSDTTSTSTLQASSLDIRLHSMSQTGARAAFRISVAVGGIARTAWQWRPCGWIELAISGAGSSATVALAVLKTRAETIGEMVQSGGFAWTYLYHQVVTNTDTSGAGSPTSCGGTITVTTTSSSFVGPAGMAGGDIYHATRTTAISPYGMLNGASERQIDTIVSVTYDDDGAPEYTTCRLRVVTEREDAHSMTVTQERESVYESAYDGSSCIQSTEISSQNRQFTVTADVTITTTITWEVRRGGVLVDSYSPGPHVAHSISTHAGSGTAMVNLDIDVTRVSTTTMLGEAQSSADAIAFGLWEDLLPESLTDLDGGEPAWRIGALRNLTPQAVLRRGNPGTRYVIAPHVLAAAVVGYGRRRYTPTGFGSYHQIAGQVLTATAAYASRHPITGQVATGSTPVCWV